MAGLLLPVLALLPVLPWAQDAEKLEELLRRAAALASAGDGTAAAAAYRGWLLAGAGSEGGAQVLLAAVDAAAEAADALRLLAEFTPRLKDTADQEGFRERQAALLQLAGRPEEALAVQLSLPETPRRLVERGLLCLEMGLTAEAEQALAKARESVDAGAAARFLLGTLYLATGRGAQGEAELRALASGQPPAPEAPAALLALGEALRERGDDEAAGEVLRELAARFPETPEAALAGGTARVRRSAVPLRLLPLQLPGDSRLAAPAQPSAPPSASPKALVQAGSFRDPENAGYLVRDLAARGFPARIVEVGDPRYFRVVVGPESSPEQAQALLLRLKDAGYEGVLLLQ